MSDVTLALAQARLSLKGFLRDPRAVAFIVIMPTLMLLLFNAVFHGFTSFLNYRVPIAAYYTAAIASYQIMLAGFGTLLIGVTNDRERGILKRLRGTPVPRWVYLAGELGRLVVIVAITVAVLVVIGSAFYHVRITANTIAGLIVYTIVGTACMGALGLAATRICPTTDSASAFGPIATVILAFVSGVFIPAALLPKWLLDLGRVFPLAHLAQGLQSAFVVPSSTGITAVDIGVLVAWGVVGLVASLLTFRWEPLAVGS